MACADTKIRCGLEPNRIAAPRVGEAMQLFDAQGVSVVEWCVLP
jgi:hypothetical protein